jgi:DNA primase
VLTEGPPDMISARACGMPALAVPGDQAWDSAWAPGFEDRDVTIVMDADRAGRLAAQRIQRDLTDAARTVTIADLAPDRQDGYDLTDWLDERFAVPRARARRARSTRHPPIAPTHADSR